MDDRPKDDEDGDPHHLRRSHKPSSATVTAAAPTKRSSARKLSLDGMSDSTDLSSSARSLSLSYPYHHLHSSPPPSSYSQQQHHHHSVDFVNPNPNLPPPLPPPNQTLTLPSAASLLPRRFFVSEGSAPNNTLDRAMSEFGGAAGTLPEFMGAGGGTGIFRVPVRAAMHPARPPALELRPHPLRETQFGAFLRTMDCTDKQLWVGQESGVRFWNLSEVFEGWGDSGNAGSGKKGDEDSAPFRVSGKTSPTLCLAVDAASGLVWSGHKDGRVRSWVIESEEKAVVVRRSLLLDLEEEDGFHFREGLSWQAHRAPVLSMVISAYGKFYYQNVFVCTWLLTIYACVKW